VRGICRRIGLCAQRESGRPLRNLRGGARLGSRYCGKNLANPTALLRSGLLMLRHLGEFDASMQIRNALEKVTGIRKN